MEPCNPRKGRQEVIPAGDTAAPTKAGAVELAQPCWGHGARSSRLMDFSWLGL